jgi:hypothetical protein
MMAIYEKPVRLLFKDMVEDFGIGESDVITRDQVFAWFKDKYPKVKDATISAHLLKMSTNAPSRIHYNVNLNGDDDLFYQLDSRRYRLYKSIDDPEPIYKKAPEDEEDEKDKFEEQPGHASEFAYERDLQYFLSKNLSLIKSDLRLYEEEGITGIEFPVGNRFIDILALDKDNNYVVIELKVSRGYDRVVGQILRYMGWLRKNQAESGQLVKGIIVAREISDDLLLACSTVDKVDLYEYQLSVSVQQITTH